MITDMAKAAAVPRALDQATVGPMTILNTYTCRVGQRAKNWRYWIVEHEDSTIRAAGGKQVQEHINSVTRHEAERSQTSAAA